MLQGIITVPAPNTPYIPLKRDFTAKPLAAIINQRNDMFESEKII
jgi:hypothetical protein